MPKFTYVVKDLNGKTKTEIMEALNEQSVVDKLQKEGYFVMSVLPLAASKSQGKAKKKAKDQFSKKKAKLEDILIFARQLATMLEAGVTLLRSLDVILTQVESKELSTVLTHVRNEVEQGRPLSASLGKHPKIFSQFWVSLIEVGEASGTMPKVLEKLAFYLEQQAVFKSTIISAIIYPAVLFFVCVGAISFFALVVGPKFESVYVSLGTDLPPLTTALLNAFKFIKVKFWWIVASIVGAVFMFKSYIKTSAGKLAYEGFLFNMPTIGRIYKLIVVERFASQMAILIDSGVPILHSLDIAEKLVENKTCSIIISDIREAVREGKLLAEPMENAEFFPAMAIQMIKVGEETGELSKMLQHVSAFYQRDVESFMKRLATLIEPFMLIFMGGVIGLIVLAMFMPMFNLGKS